MKDVKGSRRDTVSWNKDGHICIMSLKLMYKLFWALVSCLIIAFSFNSCTKINYTDNPSDVLEFSKDTLMFDSVFTTIGSITLPFTVRNTHSNALLIDEISLEGGANSDYRINVDGVGLNPDGTPLTVIEEITVLPGDSLFVFVEVTVDPNNNTSAFIVEDRIRFVTNTVEQHVDLIAYGRNAVFHHQSGNWFNEFDQPEQILECNEVWTNDLPHVIYGQLRVEPGCSLTIEEGTEVYVHKGGGIWVQGGTINIEGTLNNKVVFQGDRLDGNYPDEAGQWGLEFPYEFEYEGESMYLSVSRGGVWLDRSAESNINHAIFKNGTIGLWVDSVATGSEYALNIVNTEVSNMSAVGILSQGGYIKGVNNLFTDCGETCGAFTLGGEIVMHLSTFANYWSSSTLRTGASVYVNDWYESAGGVVQHRPFTASTEFRNCIIWGNNANLEDHDELTSDIYSPNIYTSPLFRSCALDIQYDEFPMNIIGEDCSTDLAPEFQSVISRDFHLTGNSSAWEGISSIPPFEPSEVSLDLDGMPRSTNTPDIGCYERN